MSSAHSYSAAYKRYALGMLTTVFAVNLFDRTLMMLLLEPIKQDLQLSDTQLGFITGIAFAVFYATLGVPIARWADRGNRVTIAALAIGLWGITAAACMFVSNYIQLLLARVLAGVGDAGVQPPVYSLLGDYFPEAAERSRAMYVWYMSGPIASLVSFVAAGRISEQYGWRLAFLFSGLIGLVLSIVVRYSLREPRVDSRVRHVTPPAAAPLQAVFLLLWNQPSCRNLTLAMILITTVGHGAGAWQSAFMIRYHGMGTAALGIWMGLSVGLGGVVSMIVGRTVIDRWFKDEEPGQMRLASVVVACGMPVFVGFLFLPLKEQALGAYLVQIMVFSSFLASPFILLQRLVPDGMRATALMVVLFLANLIGIGLGPLLMGLLSDLLAPSQGADALRYSMLIVSVIWLWAAWHFWRVARTIRQDLSRAQAY